MLNTPSYGFHRSVKHHNVDLSVFCDWIEGSVLFQEDPELSGSDIVDLLVDTHIYADQGFAWELLADAWQELRRRRALLNGGFPIEIHERRVQRLHEWRDAAGYTFCLVLSFAKWHAEWAKQFGKDYTEQGELFESLSLESLRTSFPGWVVHSTGWKRTQTKKLGQIVSEVAGLLSEASGEIRKWSKESANDGGLDLLLYRSFPDNRVGVPLFLTQCASGGDWEGKLSSPNLRLWGKLIQFTTEPKKAFVTPFSWDDKDFRRNCNLVDGLVLDRCRLLSPARDNPDWISADLRNKLVTWLEPRIVALPRP